MGTRAGLALLAALWAASSCAAQETPPSGASVAAVAPATPGTARDFDAGPAEPDFTVINLPTTLRLPRHRLALRLTHRFARGLQQGSFGELASDLFGLDGGAQIGLELRFGLTTTTQIGIQRTSDRTIELFAQQELARQGRSPVGLAALASVEGLENFGQDYSPRLGVVLSRTVGARAAFYAVPMWVGQTELGPSLGGSRSTLAVGLGTRLLVSQALGVLAEYTPRIAGFRKAETRDHLTFGIEGRVGGHCFQVNLSNDLGTTPAQVARGQGARRDWFVGLHLSRKFF
jgi:hypothetical protein